jgi:broad-specificity NMP kinase
MATVAVDRVARVVAKVVAAADSAVTDTVAVEEVDRVASTADVGVEDREEANVVNTVLAIVAAGAVPKAAMRLSRRNDWAA